jgi:hypothetical protein
MSLEAADSLHNGETHMIHGTELSSRLGVVKEISLINLLNCSQKSKSLSSQINPKESTTEKTNFYNQNVIFHYVRVTTAHHW